MTAELLTAEAVEVAEAARCAAMISADGHGLRRLFSDDATWIHSSGQVDGRDAFIARIESGESKYLTIDRTEVTVRLHDGAAVASGIATMTALAGGEPRSLRNRYVNVWVALGDRIVVVSAQSTKVG